MKTVIPFMLAFVLTGCGGEPLNLDCGNVLNMDYGDYEISLHTQIYELDGYVACSASTTFGETGDEDWAFDRDQSETNSNTDPHNECIANQDIEMDDSGGKFVFKTDENGTPFAQYFDEGSEFHEQEFKLGTCVKYKE